VIEVTESNREMLPEKIAEEIISYTL